MSAADSNWVGGCKIANVAGAYLLSSLLSFNSMLIHSTGYVFATNLYRFRFSP